MKRIFDQVWNILDFVVEPAALNLFIYALHKSHHHFTEAGIAHHRAGIELFIELSNSVVTPPYGNQN